MDKDQTEKATEAVKKVRDKHADEFAKLRDLPREEQAPERTELTKAINEETTKAVGEVLKPEQLTRLKQIELQRAGFMAYTRPEVQTALKLNDEQKEKVKTITEEANKQIREAFGALGAGGTRPPRGQGGAGRGQGGRGFGANNEKVTAIRKETGEKVVALLSDDQKKSWKELTGEPFTLPTTRRRRRRTTEVQTVGQMRGGRPIGRPPCIFSVAEPAAPARANANALPGPAGLCSVGLLQFLDVDVLEPQRVAVVLQLDRPLGRQRLALLPVVRQRLVIDDQLAVELAPSPCRPS